MDKTRIEVDAHVMLVGFLYLESLFPVLISATQQFYETKSENTMIKNVREKTQKKNQDWRTLHAGETTFHQKGKEGNNKGQMGIRAQRKEACL